MENQRSSLVSRTHWAGAPYEIAALVPSPNWGTADAVGFPIVGLPQPQEGWRERRHRANVTSVTDWNRRGRRLDVTG